MAKYEIELDDETAEALSGDYHDLLGIGPSIDPERIAFNVQTMIKYRNRPFEELDRAKAILKAHCMGLAAQDKSPTQGLSLECRAERMLHSMLESNR